MLKVALIDSGSQQSSMEFDNTSANVASVQSFLTAWTDAGIIGCTENTNVVITAADAAAGSNVDKKATFYAKNMTTGENLTVTLPAPNADVTTRMTEKGERILADSGQSFLDAWKIANGLGTAVVKFRWGKVTQRT